MARNRNSGHVFFSYDPHDAPAVDRLQRAAQAAGIPVWKDASVLPGEDWRATMRRAIADDALVFVACFSRARLQNGPSRQHEEITLAIEQMRARPPSEPWLIPVRFDDCVIPDWDIGAGRTLRSIRAADLFGERFDAEAGRLIASIRRILSLAFQNTEGADRLTITPGMNHNSEGGHASTTATPASDRMSIWPRLMSWDVAIRAAWIGGICVIIAALIALIPPLLGGAQSGNPSTGNHSPRTSPATSFRTWTETAFTNSRTFKDYVNAGYPLGAPLKAGQAVKVSCRVRGFKVKDGDRWWYRLASLPWSGRYYATSDVFYNIPTTSGNPINGVRVDRRVPVC